MAEIYPLQILIASLAGWMNRRQGEVLEYLIEESRVLEEQFVLSLRAGPGAVICVAMRRADIPTQHTKVAHRWHMPAAYLMRHPMARS